MSNKNSKIVLSGIGISPGFGSGTAYVSERPLQSPVADRLILPSEVDSEHDKINEAFQQVLEDLSASSQKVRERMDKSFADIFQAQIALLNDPGLLKASREELESERLNAEQAVKTVFRRFERKIRSSEDHVLRDWGNSPGDPCS